MGYERNVKAERLEIFGSGHVRKDIALKGEQAGRDDVSTFLDLWRRYDRQIEPSEIQIVDNLQASRLLDLQNKCSEWLSFHCLLCYRFARCVNR